MNPNQTQQPVQNNGQMPIEAPFNDWHNSVYNGLRDTMQKFSAAGVPGMDNVINALNKTHMNLAKTMNPLPQGVTQAQPQQQSQEPTQQDFQNLNGVMQGIINRNTPQAAIPYMR